MKGFIKKNKHQIAIAVVVNILVLITGVTSRTYMALGGEGMFVVFSVLYGVYKYDEFKTEREKCKKRKAPSKLRAGAVLQTIDD